MQFPRATRLVIFTKSQRAAERVFASITRYLTGTLRLVVNQEKSRIVASDGVEFLGFVFRGRRATINVSAKSLRRFKRRIREITGRSRGISMARRLGELRRYVRGWMGYFALASQLKLFDRLDQWIRRRLRMCYWKRWRYPRTRRRELIRLGVPRRQAIRHARSRKGPWHMAKTIASGVGMPNAWLHDQGVLSLKTLWAERAPLRRTAPVADPHARWCGEGGPKGSSLPDLPAFVLLNESRDQRVRSSSVSEHGREVKFRRRNMRGGRFISVKRTAFRRSQQYDEIISHQAMHTEPESSSEDRQSK